MSANALPSKKAAEKTIPGKKLIVCILIEFYMRSLCFVPFQAKK
jgi:hypothetical protein